MNERDLVAGMIRDFLAHLDPGTLASYFDGRLSLMERHRADEHLARCSECQKVLAGIQATKRQLEADGWLDLLP